MVSPFVEGYCVINKAIKATPCRTVLKIIFIINTSTDFADTFGRLAESYLRKTSTADKNTALRNH